jgi:uncharacterized membrane protein
MKRITRIIALFILFNLAIIGGLKTWEEVTWTTSLFGVTKSPIRTLAGEFVNLPAESKTLGMPHAYLGFNVFLWLGIILLMQGFLELSNFLPAFRKFVYHSIMFISVFGTALIIRLIVISHETGEWCQNCMMVWIIWGAFSGIASYQWIKTGGIVALNGYLTKIYQKVRYQEKEVPSPVLQFKNP